jgi:hypothetical protein
MRLGRADGNRETLLFDFPAIKLSSGSPSFGGKESGRLHRDQACDVGYTVSVGRVWYPPAF